MDLHVILTIGEYAFRRVFHGMLLRFLGVAFLVVVGILFIGGPDPEEALQIHLGWSLDLIHLSALALVVVMGATEIPQDISSRTILIILSKPVRKGEFVLGKFLGLAFVGTFVTLFLGLGVILGCVVQGKGLDAHLLQSLCFILFRALFLASVVTLFSTQLSEIPILFLTFFYVVIGTFIFYVRVLAQALHLPPPLRAVSELFYYLFANLRYLQLPPELERAGSVAWSYIGFSLLYILLYLLLMLFLSLKSFEEREIAG